MGNDSEGLRRRVIDSAWLRANDRAGKLNQLGAEDWARTLTYAGLRPLLGLKPDEIADETLGKAVKRVQQAGRQLEAAEHKRGAVRGFLPSLKDSELPVLVMAAVGLFDVLVPGSPGPLSAVMFGGILLTTVFRVLSVQIRGPAPSETLARDEMATAVRALIDSTWVSRAGDAIFENVPQAENLRIVVSRLDHTVDRARVRVDEIARLEGELATVNRALGRDTSDPELQLLRQRRERLNQEIQKVEALRGDFQARLLAAESALERLRLLARRRAVHQRIQQLTSDVDALSHTRAQGEVDLSGFDREVEALAREVADVEEVLAASVEVAGL